ncbi:hypothetical protein JW824_11565 [bacterium]|nr:hypothetical protein [bacterium]
MTDNYPSVLAGDFDHLDFPRVARQEFGIDAVDYVNTCFYDKAEDMAYLKELKN